MNQEKRENNVSLLLVEDTKEHAEYTRLLLEKQDYTVDVVADDEAAIETLRQHEPDVILMDVMLGNGSGIDLCKKLRMEDRFANIPVIFLTSSNDVQTKISGFQAGADDYITKPFKIQELAARVELSVQKKRLTESENRYRNFVQNLNDAVFMLNTRGEIVDLNPYAEKLLGAKKQFLEGSSLFQFLHKDFLQEFTKNFKNILTGKKVRGAYFRIKNVAGKSIPVETNGFSWKENRRIIQVQMIMRDITERELLQQEVQRYTTLLEKQVEERTNQLNETQRRLILSDKMSAIGQLAAGIAHELRNPLSIIGASVYYLTRVLSKNKNRKIADHLEIIQNEISRSQRIITNLLDFSRRSSPEKESADLNKIIEQTFSILERDLINHDIETIVDLDPLPLCFINVDEIKQALLNLFINAKEAMPGGGVLKIKSHLHDKKHVVIEIQDSGVGMNKEEIEKIFDPFFTTKANQDGVGLGLSLVHSSIKRNQGKISVKSEKTSGTTFFVYLPVSGI